MAYRGETADMVAIESQAAAISMPATVEKAVVPAADLRRVRLAIVLTVGLAVANLVLYAPRMF